jgi:pimeloyl-ACP methyl ester carboxylesterase
MGENCFSEVISTYLFDISSSQPSGEYASNTLLEPISFRSEVFPHAVKVGVFARDSLYHKLHSLKIPTLIGYGDHDWLHYKEFQRDLSMWRQKGGNIAADIISKAGHHLYLENLTDFHETIFTWSKKTFLRPKITL